MNGPVRRHVGRVLICVPGKDNPVARVIPVGNRPIPNSVGNVVIIVAMAVIDVVIDFDNYEDEDVDDEF